MAMLRLEQSFHQEKGAAIIHKLHSQKPGVDADDVAPVRIPAGDEETSTSHVESFFYNLFVDSKGLTGSLSEIKQNLEFGGITLEENLNKVQFCINMWNEVVRLYSWLHGSFAEVLGETEILLDHRLRLDSSLRENEGAFESLFKISRRLILQTLDSGVMAGKLLCILYVIARRRPLPAGLQAELQREGSTIMDVVTEYTEQRKSRLLEQLEKNQSIESFVRAIYAEYSFLSFLFTFKLTCTTQDEYLFNMESPRTTEALGKFVYHSILEKVALTLDAEHPRLPRAIFGEMLVLEEGEGDKKGRIISVLVPEEEKLDAANNIGYDDVELLQSGLEDIEDRHKSGTLASTCNIDIPAVTKALEDHTKTLDDSANEMDSWGPKRHHTCAFTQIFLRGLKRFVNDAVVSIFAFPHSISMKDLFHLHSKSMHLSEITKAMQGVLERVTSANSEREIVLDHESGTRAVVRLSSCSAQRQCEDTLSDLSKTNKALMLSIAKLSDCLLGEIRSSAENVLQSNVSAFSKNYSPEKLVEEIGLICNSMLEPIFQVLESLHPVTQSKFALQAVVAVIHGFLLKLKTEIKLPRQSQALAEGLQESIALIRSCMEKHMEAGRLLQAIQEDSNYHLYESSLLRSKIVLNILKEPTAARETAESSLLPDFDEWPKPR